MQSLIQGSKEWLEMRRSKIGASDAPVIMGVSPWKTPYQLWEQKVEGKEYPINAFMQRGIDLEEEARLAFCSISNIAVLPCVCVHPEKDWMIASLDGIDMEGGAVIVEIKCPGERDHELARQGKIPEHYYPQLQHQMEVTGLSECYYFSYRNKEGISIKILRDQDYIKKMIKEEEKFYKCMENLIPPDMCERDFSEVTTSEWMESSAEWKKISEEIKFLESYKQSIFEKLVSLSEGKNVRGNGVRLSKMTRKGNIDYSTIPEIKNINLEDYRKKSIQYWQIHSC